MITAADALDQLEARAVNAIKALGERGVFFSREAADDASAYAAIVRAAPQSAQADEAREIIAEAYTRLGIDPQFAARCEAYLARTGGKEE